LEVRGNLFWSARDLASERDLRNWRALNYAYADISD
jgi:hypothetical protein